jgi:uncharacterized protein (DUF305 family)
MSTADGTDTSPLVPSAGHAGSARRYGLSWLVAALVLGALLGTTVGLVAPRLGRPGNDSAEAGFLRDMSIHHAQAVEMGMIAYAKASDPEVKILGSDIALTQHGQVNIMQTWLRDWGLNLTGDQPLMAWMPDAEGSVVNGLMPGMATPDAMADLRNATGTAVDVQFLTLMRQHHLGGVHMAKEIIELSDNAKVTDLARIMVSTQQREMTDMQAQLTRIQQ